MKKILIFLFAVIAYNGNAQSLDQLNKDMYGIASDATNGRFTGSTGYLKAAKYVANNLKAVGIKTTFQPVPFIHDNYDGSSISVSGKTYSHTGGNFVVLQHAAQSKGRWVVSNSMPDSVAERSLRAKKVAGVILLPDSSQGADWETAVIRQYRFGYMHYKADYTPSRQLLTYILVSPQIAAKIKRGYKPAVSIRYKQENINGYNVIAKFPGTSKAIKNQTIIAGAHLDHIGKFGKHIYNGANDDGSGCAALLSAARMLTANPTKRPLLFVFYCGEELNLLGSRYFIEHPPLPVKNILMNINLEQMGSRHRSFHGIWAIGDKQFENDFRKSGTMFNGPDLKFTPADSLQDVLSNTDSYSFMKNGIPSLLLGSGGFDEHHSTKDKIDLIDFEHLQKASKLLYQLIKELGDNK